MIHWKRSDDGYVSSHDGLWLISPNFYSHTKPQSFTLQRKVQGRWIVVDRHCATQRDAKEAASRQDAP